MVRVRPHEFFELHQLELRERDLLALGLPDPPHLEPEGHVSKRGAPREQLGEVLKHHAAVGAVTADRFAADADFARGGARKPAMTLSSVDLPQPEGPTMHRNSEASMSKLTPATPGTSPAGVS